MGVSEIHLCDYLTSFSLGSGLTFDLVGQGIYFIGLPWGLMDPTTKHISVMYNRCPTQLMTLMRHAVLDIAPLDVYFGEQAPQVI